MDRVHQNGYQHRALEDDIYAEKEKRAAAEKDRDHWRQARQEAIEAGELMQAEIERLRAFVGKVRNARDFYEWPKSWQQVEAALAELDAGTGTEGGQ